MTLTEKVDVSHNVILYLEEVTVSFDGFKALNNLNFYVNNNELRCVIGPNGAGKTTMMDVITGKTRPDKGSVFYGQNLDLTNFSDVEIARMGIGRKFQKPTVFYAHTVLENLELAVKSVKSPLKSLFYKQNSEELEQINEVLDITELSDLRKTIAGTLSHGQKQWLEIGMLLMQDPKLLLIDEPVAGMTPPEIELTAELLISLSRNHSVVVVEHDMEFIRSIAKKVTVLHEGTVLAEGTMDEVRNDEEVMRVYLGE